MAIQTLNTIKNWFKTGSKPSQDQFWDTWDSFRHKYEKVPIKDIEELETTLDTKAEKSQLDDHKNDQIAHAGLFSGKEDKYQKGVAGGYVPLDEFSKIAHQYLNLINNLTAGGENSILSAEQGVILQNQIDNINRLLKCDNVDLDTVQKIVDAVTQIQTSIDTILVNDLTLGGVTKALTAEMGKILDLNKEDKSQKGLANGYAPLDSLTKLASQYLYIVNDLITGGATSILSAEQGKLLQNQINGINTLLSSDNIDLDTIQEIVDAIENVESYLSTILVNDLKTGGVAKALTAEMGKQLDQIKLTATLATDAETQTTVSVAEDNKVVSRSKLFNWWESMKSQAQTIKAVWNFSQGLKVNNSTGNYVYTTQILEDVFISQLVSAGLGTYKVQYNWESIKWFLPNGFYTQLIPNASPTQNNQIKLPNKAGTVALINDFVTTASGTTTTPAVIVPNGLLTTVPQNGAIERDSNGILWETHGNVRTKITSTIQNNLTTTNTNDVLDAKQGSVIMGYISVLGSLMEGFRNSTQGRSEYKILNLSTITSDSAEQNILHPYLLKTIGAINLINATFRFYNPGSLALYNNPANRDIDPSSVNTNDKLMSDMDFIIQTKPFCGANLLKLKINLQGWGKMLIFRRSNANTAAYARPFTLIASIDFGNSSEPGTGVIINQAIKTSFSDGILGFILVHGTNTYYNSCYTINYLSFAPDMATLNGGSVTPVINSAFETQTTDISNINL